MIIVFGTEEQLKRNTCHGTSRDHRETWLHGRHAAPRERRSCGAGAGPPRVPTARHGCHSSATHTPSPQDESLATEGGPSPLPWSTGPWERLPLALVSLAELTPDGRPLHACSQGWAQQPACWAGRPGTFSEGHGHCRASCPQPLVSPRMACGAVGARGAAGLTAQAEGSCAPPGLPRAPPARH